MVERGVYLCIGRRSQEIVLEREKIRGFLCGLNADCRRCWLWEDLRSIKWNHLKLCSYPIMRRLPDRGISAYLSDHVIREF